MATTAAAAPPIIHCGPPVIIGTPPVLAFVLMIELLDVLVVEISAELPAAVAPPDAVLLEPIELPVFSPAAVLVVVVADAEAAVLLAPGSAPAVIVTACAPISDAKFA